MALTNAKHNGNMDVEFHYGIQIWKNDLGKF